MDSYKVLNQQIFTTGEYSIVPIRYEDRMDIMKWRNEQMYHLRQSELLTESSQNSYFNNVVKQLFCQDKPDQLLFSFLKDEVCIGYGGLVHINWIDKNAEISFIMDTTLETGNFETLWVNFLALIQKLGFDELNLHKIFTYAFDLRPHLYIALEKAGFVREAILIEHCYFENKYVDVVIHSKKNNEFSLEKATRNDVECTYNWVKDTKIRQFSFSKDPISLEQHEKWFLEKINNMNCNYYIARMNTKEVGSIRFDIEGSSATLSYLIDSSLHGKGLGKVILSHGINRLEEDRPDIKIVKGLVMLENKASIRIFESLNFEKEINKTNLVFYKEINGE